MGGHTLGRVCQMGRTMSPDPESINIRQIEFALEKAERGMAMPYDAGRVVVVQRPDPCFSTSSRTPPRAASLLGGGVDVVVTSNKECSRALCSRGACAIC